jgi:uncharacterized membrane protein (DUF485 family)
MVTLSLLQSAPTFVIALVLFILIIFFYLIGHRLRSKAIKKNPDLAEVDFGAINGMLLALLGLLLAFTFSMSNSRFDTRRQLIIEESNNIGTVILRTDIYPDSVRQLLRTNLKEYVEQRIEFYKVGMNVTEAVKHYLKADSVGKVVWSIVATYARVDNTTTRTSEMIPALNAMIDITTTRMAAGEATIPDPIMYFLFMLCLGSAFLLGYEKGNKIDWIVVIGFGLMLSLTVYAIIDLDRPRSGLISMDTPHRKMEELRSMFK